MIIYSKYMFINNNWKHFVIRRFYNIHSFVNDSRMKLGIRVFINNNDEKLELYPVNNNILD